MNIGMIQLILLALCVTESLENNENKYVDIPGDIKLGALFPIHKQGHGKPCGYIQREDGIQPLEAMLFAIDEINQNKKLLPGIKLGVKAFDSCDNPHYADTQYLPLIKEFVFRSLFDRKPILFNDHIVGLIGPQTSPVSVQIASLGRLFKVPQVSYLATSVALCNRDKYPYFYRTVPSDLHQSKAIVELLREFNWHYASIVHSDSDYGETGYNKLKQHVADTQNICLADPITIYNSIFTSEDYTNVIFTLLKNKQSKVVIVFADRVPAGKLLEAAKAMGVKDKLIWIGSDAWASRESVVEGREEIVEGAIAVQPLRRELPGFDAYFKKLLKTDNSRNPWFKEYISHYHDCDPPKNSNLTLYCNRRKGQTNVKEKNASVKYSQQLYVHFVRDAVYAFAHALDTLHTKTCGKNHKLCPEFEMKVFTDLKDYLQNVSFPDVSNNTFEFHGHFHHDIRHDGPPRYTIINFQKNTNGPGTYDWLKVGTFHHNKFTELDETFKRKYSQQQAITQCQRRPCNESEVIVQSTKDMCCWHCRACTDLEYKASDYECRACPIGSRSIDPRRIDCELIPETHLGYTHPLAIGAIVFSLIGIILTLVTAMVLWKYWNTPVVKACGRELSLLLLLGTLFSFMTTFFIVDKPSVINCGIMRFSIGFCYTVCYAAVVTKTNRVARIFSADNNIRFISPLSSLVIAGSLISVEVLFNIIWLIIEPPTTTHIVTEGGIKRVLVCKGVNDSFMAGLVYPFFLIICATLYAFKTRKCPGGFNETRFIFFANSVNCIHWIAYVPLYLVSTDPEIRAVILAFSLSLSGVVQLTCLLLPRVYTVLFKPEKNTRGDVMTHRQQQMRWVSQSSIHTDTIKPRSNQENKLELVPNLNHNHSSSSSFGIQENNQQIIIESNSNSVSCIGLHTNHKNSNDNIQETTFCVKSPKIKKITFIVTNSQEDLNDIECLKEDSDHDVEERLLNSK